MGLKICELFVVAISFLAVIFLARKDGKNAAKVEQLKQEIEREAKERQRAQGIIDNVRNMSDDDVSERLQDVSSK